MIAKYEEHKASGAMDHECVLCTAEPLETFTYWKIIQNDFPYDRIAETHHMIVPRRHCIELDLTNEEKIEFSRIKKDVLDRYNYIIEPTNTLKSIPNHFHLHLIIRKTL